MPPRLSAADPGKGRAPCGGGKQRLSSASHRVGFGGGGPAAFPNFAGGGGGPADLPGPRFFSVGVVGEPGGDGSDLKKKAERVPDQNTLN